MAEPRRAQGEPTLAVAGARILVVESRFYEDISDALLAGATLVLYARLARLRTDAASRPQPGGAPP